MVGIGVGQHDRLDVVDRSPDAGQRRLERVAVAADPGVDERDLAVLFQQVEVHEFGAEHMDHRVVLPVKGWQGR